MIKDNIANAARYYCLGESFEAALRFLASYAGSPEDKDDIRVSDAIAVKCRPYMTKPASECSFEAHVQYADIHFVAAGSECIGYAPIDTLTEKSRNPEKDTNFYDGKGVSIPLRKGDFMITMPWDAHMPGVCDGEPAMCGKLIVKIKL